MLGDNITFTPIDSRGKWDRDVQEGKEALQMCVYGCCEIQLDGSQGPKHYLFQNHPAFTVWCEIQRGISSILHFQSIYFKFIFERTKMQDAEG